MKIHRKFWYLEHLIFRQDLGSQNRILEETSSFLLFNETSILFSSGEMAEAYTVSRVCGISIYFNCNVSNMGQEDWCIKKWHLVGRFFFQYYTETF